MNYYYKVSLFSSVTLNRQQGSKWRWHGLQNYTVQKKKILRSDNLEIWMARDKFYLQVYVTWSANANSYQTNY